MSPTGALLTRSYLVSSRQPFSLHFTHRSRGDFGAMVGTQLSHKLQIQITTIRVLNSKK